MARQQSKIEREKIDYLKTLFLLCVRIDKQVVDISSFKISDLKKVERGIIALEKKLKPFEETTTQKKINAINGKIKKLSVTDVDTWNKAFDLLMEKYGLLHDLMDVNNLLLKEQEESEA